MDKKTRFTGKADNYTKGRPSYSPELLNYIYTTIGVSATSTVADIGAGTGIFSKQLAGNGCSVICIEPNDDMRNSAAANLADCSNVTIIKGDAESTTLDQDSVDFITAAQAFHWFDTDKFIRESKRILKSNGISMLIWNQRDTESKFGKAYQSIFAKYCPNYKGFSGGLQKHDERIKNYFNGNYHYAEFNNDIIYDQDQFINRCLSSSYSLKPGDEQFPHYLAELFALYACFSQNGLITEPNKSVIYWGVMQENQ